MVRACKTEENDWEKLHRLPSDRTTETCQATMRSGMKAFGIDQEMVMDCSGPTQRVIHGEQTRMRMKEDSRAIYGDVKAPWTLHQATREQEQSYDVDPAPRNLRTICLWIR